MENTYDYDVAVTFAGEDRQFVDDVVRKVKASKYTVFYDQDEQITLWGEELTEYFPKIYEERARFAVMFVSRHYAAKPWTTFERRSVLVRALRQETPYLLPVRLDNTKLDGVRSTIQYLDGAAMGPAGIADAILRKLGGAHAEGGGSFNGYVPRNEHEAIILLGERPAGWEYLLFSYALVRGVEERHEAYLDHCMEFAQPREFVPTDHVVDVMQREMATIFSIIRNFANVLSEPAHRAAFGEPGDVDRIVHMANRYVAVYESFLDWAARLRSHATLLDEAHELFRAVAFHAQQPIELMRDFAYEFRDMADSLHAKLMAGEDVFLQLALALEVTPEASVQFDRALREFQSASIDDLGA